MNELATHPGTSSALIRIPGWRTAALVGKTALVRRIAVFSLALFVLASSVLPSRAEGTNDRVVDDVRIYLGVIPAAMVRGNHPATHTENTMHGGGPSGDDEYHVLIALFNAKTGERISNARVSARVAEVGLSGEEKTLEPMRIADTTTYGNFFTMKGSGLSRINVIVRIPGAREISVTFQHRHGE